MSISATFGSLRASGEERQDGVRISAIGEVGGSDECRAAKFGEVVEHQDTAAAPEGPNLKSAAEIGEAILAYRNGIMF